MREIIVRMTEEYYKENLVKGYVLPELIRCKDCKHRNDLELFGRTYHLCERFDKTAAHQIDDLENYCSWAVRRTE